MLNRLLCKRTFPGRTASSPTQLSRALTSLRTPDHAVPNDAALCRSRGERVQLSFFSSMRSRRGYCRGSPALLKASSFDASPWQGDAPAGVHVRRFRTAPRTATFHTTGFEHPSQSIFVADCRLRTAE